MTWNVHEGGKQIDASSQKLHSVSWPTQPDTCEMCTHYSSQFMQCAADAIKHATLKPDDQIWFAVFSTLQEVLTHRASCSARYTSQSAGTPSRENPVNPPQAQDAHSAPQEAPVRAFAPTQKSVQVDRVNIRVPSNNVTATQGTLLRGTALSWLGLKASPHPSSVEKGQAQPVKKRSLIPETSIR